MNTKRLTRKQFDELPVNSPTAKQSKDFVNERWLFRERVVVPPTGDYGVMTSVIEIIEDEK